MTRRHTNLIRGLASVGALYDATGLSALLRSTPLRGWPRRRAVRSSRAVR